jgi:hypothetical protein
MTTLCKSMKSFTSIPTLLTVIVVAIVIALLSLPPPLPISAYSDDSETDAEQRLRQKNLGSGESSDFNCDENMITSASTDCIPSGPAAPTPPTPPTGAFTIAGGISGGITCEGAELAPAGMSIDVTGAEDGTVTGTVVIIVTSGPTVLLTVTDGTTDGNTFSLSGENNVCTIGEPLQQAEIVELV